METEEGPLFNGKARNIPFASMFNKGLSVAPKQAACHDDNAIHI